MACPYLNSQWITEGEIPGFRRLAQIEALRFWRFCRTFLIFWSVFPLTNRIGRRYFEWKVEGDKL